MLVTRCCQNWQAVTIFLSRGMLLLMFKAHQLIILILLMFKHQLIFARIKTIILTLLMFEAHQLIMLILLMFKAHQLIFCQNKEKNLSQDKGKKFHCIQSS
jgi:hypothetical protein